MHKLAMILCVTSVSLTAQWPNHPTPGLPRTPDGKLDLTAPAPRSADGKPDLSGVWMPRNSGSLFYVTQDLKPGEIQPWADAINKQREADYRRIPTASIACLPVRKPASVSATCR